MRRCASVAGIGVGRRRIAPMCRASLVCGCAWRSPRPDAGHVVGLVRSARTAMLVGCATTSFAPSLTHTHTHTGGSHDSAVDSWRAVKEAICEAAEAARRRQAEADNTDLATTDGVLRSISRVVMRADVWLGRRLRQHSALARQELGVESGRVFLLDGAGFAERFAAARTAALERSDKEACADGRKGKSRRRAL